MHGDIINRESHESVPRRPYAEQLTPTFKWLWRPDPTKNAWNNMTSQQRRGIERAMEEVQKSAFAYQTDGLLVKQGLMQDQGVNVHYQTKAERKMWKAFLAPSLEAWVQAAPDPGEAEEILAAIAPARTGNRPEPRAPSGRGGIGAGVFGR